MRLSNRWLGVVESWGIGLTLVVLGVSLRLWFQDVPNFAPVAAIALFSGYLLSSPVAAAAIPILTMLISDRLIGGYQPALMVANYALLACPVWFGHGWQRRSALAVDGPNSSRQSGLSFATCLIGGSLAASIVFFLGSNLMTWVVTPWYSRDLNGLIRCYANAIPFFRYTLLGDLCFASLLFAGWQAAQRFAFDAPRTAGEIVRR